MRKFLQFPLMVVLSVLTFAACDKDDDDNGGGAKNEIKVGSETFKIEKAAQYYYEFEEDEKLVNIDLSFEIENDYELDIEMLLPAENEKLAKGTYTYSEEKEKAFTFFAGIFFNKKEERVITAGKVIIDVDGETYTVTLDITLDDKEKLGSYGKLPIEDYDYDEDDEEEEEEENEEK